MSFLLGLTGSIGMGKSTTTRLFAEAGCAIWDADAAVHRAYAPGGSAVAAMKAAFPDAVNENGVSRLQLRKEIMAEPEALKRIEAIVHPLVSQDRADFIAAAVENVVVLDIPLLFETGRESEFDAIACVTVSGETQRERVLARGTMSAEQFEAIKARQMPDAEKRARSDYVIVTDTFEHARLQVKDVLADIERRMTNA